MKKTMLFILAWLLCEASYSQNKTTNLDFDSQPITTKGISLPQLITKNLNRSNLQFKLNLSEGLKRPDLSVNFKQFISDSKKQFTLSGGTGISHTLSFTKNDNRDFYLMNGINAHLGADLKLFNKKDYFLQIGTQNSINKIGDLTDFDFINTYNSVTVGFGKGRINFSNDGAAAIAITDKLSQYGLLTRNITDDEYLQLTNLIQNLKNRRKFVNRSYPFSEAEEIQALLESFGLLKEGIDALEVLDNVYRIEPIFDRTTGSQFKISATGSYVSSNLISRYDHFGLAADISYEIHTPINNRWQHNKKISGYASLNNQDSFEPPFQNDLLDRVGINLSNELHYQVDTRIRYSVTNTIGYDFVNNYYLNLPIQDLLYDRSGLYIKTGLELQYQISRTMSTTFGIDVNLGQGNNYTGLKLGLNF
jgi:hypothetical protein